MLIVEDDADIRAMMALALADAGYEVREAADGRTGFELLESWRPDLVVLDLLMPAMNGWQFRDLQRAFPATAPIPVVVTTALSQLPPVLDRLGAAASLAKPFDVAELVATVGRVLATVD